jgi:hypothetical protein
VVLSKESLTDRREQRIDGPRGARSSSAKHSVERGPGRLAEPVHLLGSHHSGIPSPMSTWGRRPMELSLATPQVASMRRICSISGLPVRSIVAASPLTCGEDAYSAARSHICTACSWRGGIMPWTMAISTWL